MQYKNGKWEDDKLLKDFQIKINKKWTARRGRSAYISV